MSKRITIFLLILLACSIVLIGVYIAIDNQEVFTGIRIKNPDRYFLEFSQMNQNDTHVISLECGDTILVEFYITEGHVDLMIGEEGQTPIYRGNDICSGSFSVKISQSGAYMISVQAKHAKGRISVSLQER